MDTTTREAENFRSATDHIADSVHDMSERAGNQARKLAEGAADGVRRTADYVRDTSMSDMAGQVKDYLKANPSHALIGAAVAGFLLGRLMSRD